MNIEDWILNLLINIKEAGINGQNFDLHLEAGYVTDIAYELDKIVDMKIYYRN